MVLHVYYVYHVFLKSKYTNMWNSHKVCITMCAIMYIVEQVYKIKLDGKGCPNRVCDVDEHDIIQSMH